MRRDLREDESLPVCLRDIGCDEKTIEEFFACLKEGRTEEQLRLLEGHRELLLKRIHEDEKRIACLDYLIYMIKKDQAETDIRP